MNSQNLIQIVTRTWNRDSHDLYDYEALNVAKTTHLVQTSSRCVRLENNIKFFQEYQEINEGEYLLRAIHRDDKFWVMPPERLPSLSTVKKMWLIVKHLPEHKHALTEGDVIKLGRFRLRVKQISTVPRTAVRIDESETPILREPSDPDRVQCRICLLEGSHQDEPLIAPCQCKGSIEYVHIDCLRHWVTSKQLTHLPDTPGCFYYKQPLCELCRAPLPQIVRIENKAGGLKQYNHYNITQVPEVQAPFIVLESMSSQNHQQRGIHILSMSNDRKVLKLGRGHESEVRIPDVSISRYHASLRIMDDKFYIEDHSSKFGTLVLVKKPLSVSLDKPTVVQIGRTVVEVNLKPVSSVAEYTPGGIFDVPVQSDADVDMVDDANNTNSVANNNDALDTSNFDQSQILDQQQDGLSRVSDGLTIQVDGLNPASNPLDRDHA